MEVMGEDMLLVGLRGGDAMERVRWKQLICCGDL